MFLLLDMAPGDPTAQLPLTIPPEVRQMIRESLDLGEPVHIRYLLWLKQSFVTEPHYGLESLTGWKVAPEGAPRVISWQTRSPVIDLVLQRMPQTLWVMGMSYMLGVLIAVPIGVISAYRQY